MVYYAVQMHDGELYHHGILGQKWGQRNGPPYPLGSGDHSSREVKAGWRKSLSNSSENSTKNKSSSKKSELKSTDNTRKTTKDISEINSIKNNLYVDEKRAQDLKRAAKILGITAGTAAGMLALGYLTSNPEVLNKLLKSPNSYFQALESGYNNSGAHYRYLISEINSSRKNGDLVGRLADAKGYGNIDSNYIKNAISNRLPNTHADLNGLIEEMRMNVKDEDGPRRLSCWSGSHAYFMSTLTGHDFVSKSYNNLVNFNNFNKLYNKPQTIFDLNGKVAKDFVGKFGDGFGKNFRRADEMDAAKLLRSIADNITKDINLTPDGSRSIGFIDAAYGGTTCTHQWNFEVEYLANNVKRIFMADSYVGTRYPVADMSKKGVSYLDGFNDLTKELHHYNAESIRFYAPSLSDINTSNVSKIILGKTKEPNLEFFGLDNVSSQISKATNKAFEYINNFDYSSLKSLSADDKIAKYENMVNDILKKFEGINV